jgi:putative PEP-CTERM system histidine kinase
VVISLLLVEGLQFVLLVNGASVPVVEVSALLRMLVAVGALVLAHNLFGGASQSSRRLLGWNSSAMALFWLFELNLFTIAYLTGSAAAGLDALRALVMMTVAAAFAVGSFQARAGLAFRPSRAVTFSTLSLVVLTVYFLGMIGLANGLSRFSGELARATQVGFLLAAATVSLVWLPSTRLRNLARVLALKHFFKHRYDYRAEWLRFTRTIGSAAGQGASLHERAVQSLADITDSTAGLLLTPQDDGEFALAAQWRWPTMAVPRCPLPPAFARLFEQRSFILDLDEVRSGINRHGEAALVPDWLREEQRAWAGVPLLHGERLVGLVILARPQVARGLDWEDFDLLTIAGQQIASYLSEQAGQEALQDAARFDEFNRRMAFVMHDIKNLSSQLGLLARNAEKHADNPAFRSDMLVTLRNSADKLDALVTRLGRYGSGRSDAVEAVDLMDIAQRVARRLGPSHPIDVVGDSACEVSGNADTLEQAVVHLVQNAIDASLPGAPVMLELRIAGLRGELAVIDSGTGMSAEFLRQSLFRPFVSTKDNGFGIGACEARELVRAMGGRLDAESREGLGSRFTVSLPLAEASRLRARQQGSVEFTSKERAA